MGAEALDLALRSLDHRFEVGHELIVHRVVGGAESVECGCAGSIENPEHGQMLVRASRHGPPRARDAGSRKLPADRPLRSADREVERTSARLAGATTRHTLASPSPTASLAATLLDLMDAREERLARNETLFRSVNENIEQVATLGHVDEHTFEFFCECSNVDCTLQLPMTVAEYERIRADPKQFMVAPGHELPEIETVVARKSAYHVVVKEGEAAEFVTERDPRSE